MHYFCQLAFRHGKEINRQMSFSVDENFQCCQPLLPAILVCVSIVWQHDGNSLQPFIHKSKNMPETLKHKLFHEQSYSVKTLKLGTYKYYCFNGVCVCVLQVVTGM